MANCSPYFTALQYINNLETQGSYKTTVNLKNLNPSRGLKATRSFVKVEQNVYKTVNKSASILTNQILFSSNQLELSTLSFTHVFKTIKTIMRWNCISKALRFLQITAEHQDCPVFTVFIAIKTSSQNISFTLLQISLKLHEHRGGFWRKKFQLRRFWPWKTLSSHLKWVHTWHGGCPSCPKKTACCVISYGYSGGSATQSGIAESRTGGVLELRAGISAEDVLGRPS